MSRGSSRRRPGAEGFTLLEAVAAAAVLLVTVTAATGTVVSGSRASARLQRTMEVDDVLRSEVERLRALPYCAPVRAEDAAGSAVAGGVLDEVFPHALTEAGTADARYVAAGDGDVPAGAFVSVVECGAITVTRVARFLDGSGEAALGPDAVAGWAVWGADLPPGAAVEVLLEAVAGQVSRSCRVELRAVDAPLDPSDTPAGGVA